MTLTSMFLRDVAAPAATLLQIGELTLTGIAPRKVSTTEKAATILKTRHREAAPPPSCEPRACGGLERAHLAPQLLGKLARLTIYTKLVHRISTALSTASRLQLRRL